MKNLKLKTTDQNSKLFRVAQKIALFNEKNEILVLRFSKENPNLPQNIQGKWDFPGGGLNWEESRDEGLKREIKEEIGEIKYTIGNLIYVWDWYHQTIGSKPEVRTVCVLYEGKYKGGEIVLNNEHDLYQWISIEKVMDLEWSADIDTVKQIQQLLKSKKYDEK